MVGVYMILYGKGLLNLLWSIFVHSVELCIAALYRGNNKNKLLNKKKKINQKYKLYRVDQAKETRLNPVYQDPLPIKLLVVQLVKGQWFDWLSLVSYFPPLFFDKSTLSTFFSFLCIQI